MEREWCVLNQKYRDLELEWRDLEQILFRTKNGVIRE